MDRRRRLNKAEPPDTREALPRAHLWSNARGTKGLRPAALYKATSEFGLQPEQLPGLSRPALTLTAKGKRPLSGMAGCSCRFSCNFGAAISGGLEDWLIRMAAGKGVSARMSCG